MPSGTYDPTLSSDKDWVRFLIGDRAADSPVLDDLEIEAVLAVEKNKWLAAARCGEIIATKGKGVVSKSVGDLSLSYGDSPESAYRAHIKKLREKGADELLKPTGSHVMRVL